MNACEALVTWNVTAVRQLFDKENCREYVVREYEPIDLLCRQERHTRMDPLDFLDCVRHLVRMGATANTKRGTLRYCMYTVDEETILEFLKLTKADPNHTGNDDDDYDVSYSPLILAIILKLHRVTHALLELGANPCVGVHDRSNRVSSPQFITPSIPLHEAIVLRNREVIHDLLAHGADPFQEDVRNGLRAIHWARHMNVPDIYTFFKNLEDARALHARTMPLLEKELVEYVFHPSRLSKQGYFECT
jgi:hypothetical protein